MTRSRSKRVCVDCVIEGVTTRRNAKFPGPRCATHHRLFKRASSDRRKAAHVEKNFQISDEEYKAILKAQGGVCYICGKKPGYRRRLSVDHDHNLPCGVTDHPRDKGCYLCIRGLLHSKCNSFLGWVGDDPQAGLRMNAYLINPPARAVLALMRGINQ